MNEMATQREKMEETQKRERKAPPGEGRGGGV